MATIILAGLLLIAQTNNKEAYDAHMSDGMIVMWLLLFWFAVFYDWYTLLFKGKK